MFKLAIDTDRDPFAVAVRARAFEGWEDDEFDRLGGFRTRWQAVPSCDPFPVLVAQTSPGRTALLSGPEPGGEVTSCGVLSPSLPRGGEGQYGQFHPRQTDGLIIPGVGETASHVIAHESRPYIIPRSTATPAQRDLPVTLREGLVELRAELMLAAEARGLQTVAVCGAEAGDGASFVAHHLSRLCAEFARLQVALLVVEARRKGLIGRRSRPTNGSKLLLRRTEAPNLHEVVSARGVVTLADLLGWAEPGALLARMKTMCDLVVMDLPSAALNAEAAVLAAQADGVILVARRDRTPRARLDRAHRRLSKARARVLGVVFNRES